MPLQTIGPAPTYMTVLSPPGNLASELESYRRELFRLLGSPGALPFPCVAPLALSVRPPEESDLSELAASAPRSYDRLSSEAGFLLLAPSADEASSRESVEAAAPSSSTVKSDLPFPVGLGFPLAYFPETSVADIVPRLPAPPRLSFKTFLAVVLEIRMSDPWTSGLVWKPVSNLRYPLRIL